MKIANEIILTDGDTHSLRLSPDGLHPTTVDYFSGTDIFLHLSVRPADRLVVVNDYVDGKWGEEKTAFFTNKNATIVIQIQFSSVIKVSVDEVVTIGFESKGFPKKITSVTSSAELEFFVGRELQSREMAESGTRPEYIDRVLAELNSVEIGHLRGSFRPMPDRLDPIVISVVKNEFDRLPDFFRHYREAGILRFVFIDNGSTDETVEYLTSQPDVDVYTKACKFDWVLKQGWINWIIRRYGYDRWYIYIDADEHIVFDGIGHRSFRDLATHMEIKGIARVRGMLVDMYSNGPLLESHYDATSRLDDAYPFMDSDGYKEAKYKEIISVKGGPRSRAFGRSDGKFRPEMTKYPLFRAERNEYMVNPHHIWPYKKNFLSERYLAILHYKFLPGVIDRINKAIEEKNYWDGSFEYQCYLDVLKASPELSLMYHGSIRYQGPTKLVERGIIAPCRWADAVTPGDRMRSSYRRRSAELASSASLFVSS